MAKTSQETNNQLINLIGKGTVITGDIKSEGDMRIDGELNGNITSNGRVVIGHTGKVTGEVSCKNCELAGYVKGKIIIEQLITLKATSTVLGEIATDKLSIEPGAVFSGNCTMENQAQNEKAKNA
ncbi:polymer-forming cytoskeletal protein [Mangrovibacterium marinum]|uniref:Cytoskeletal protein CcmA (Bactofilin family) n=1 Tax=Mangrovibacterium marinum TaxID=1639118 RepID=A0A2T5C6D4_9BACT|nr:polymer-forming cytoskeletal protein [Mangrovibacterium marinum]PTN10510.1 cytoskeletal protein CcmA (bactofilin family) [Mangrovibacterium marinum]